MIRHDHVLQCDIIGHKFAGKMAEEDTLSDPTTYMKELKDRCPNVVYIFTTRQAKLLSQTCHEPYDPKGVNQQFLSDYNAWASMKQKVDQSRQSLRRDMLTPHPVDEAVAAEEFMQQTEVLKEVRIIYYHET